MPDTPTLEIFGLQRCDTCRKARRWLDEHEVAHTFHDYREHPIPAARLRQWAQRLGGWDKLINRASTTWRNLPETERTPATDDDWLSLLGAHPTLIRRPVWVTGQGEVGVGFKEAVWHERLGRP